MIGRRRIYILQNIGKGGDMTAGEINEKLRRGAQGRKKRRKKRKKGGKGEKDKKGEQGETRKEGK